MLSRNEKSKLICDFMGLFDKTIKHGENYVWGDSPFYSTSETDLDKLIENVVNYSKYDSSWDWIMPVVLKIESLGFDVQISGGNACYVVTSEIELLIEVESEKTKLECVFRACAEFIEWYNQQK